MQNLDSGFVNSPKSSKKFWFFIIVGVAVFLLLGVFYFTKIVPLRHKNQTIKQSGIPPSFILSDSVKSLPAPAPKEFPLASAEKIVSGLEYQMPVSWKEAAKQIGLQMQQQGWVAIAGSNLLANGQLIKLGKGSESMIIKIVKGPSDSSSIVTVYKIQHK